MISAITHLGIMIPYSDTFLIEMKNRGSERADDLPEFTVHENVAEQDWNLVSWPQSR